MEREVEDEVNNNNLDLYILQKGGKNIMGYLLDLWNLEQLKINAAFFYFI